MAEASWGETGSPAIDWRMSAALEDVPRGDADVAEVTSLEEAVRAWARLDEGHRHAAKLTPERAVMIDGAPVQAFHGEHIGTLLARLTDGAGDGPDRPDASA